MTSLIMPSTMLHRVPQTYSGRSPFEVLPPELISQIFATYLNISLPRRDTRNALCNLCLTCRQWKEIVYGTAELWAIVGVTIGVDPDESLVGSVSAWLKRSHQHPLRISLAIDGYVYIMFPFFKKVVDPILTILSQEVHRWLTISFSFGNYPMSQLFMQNLAVAPMLESLEIYKTEHAIIEYEWLTRFMSRAPNLRTFRSNLLLAMMATTPTGIPFAFKRLSTVKIDSALKVPAVLTLFGSLPNLSICHINLAPNDSWVLPTTADQQALIVCHASELKVGVRESFNFFEAIWFPKLKKFELHFLNRQIVQPLLEETPFYGFLNRIATTLECFTIRNLFIKDTSLLACLQVLSQGLRSLRILADHLFSAEYYDIENVTDLVISSLHCNQTNEDPLCPKLEALTLQRCISTTDGLLGEMITYGRSST